MMMSAKALRFCLEFSPKTFYKETLKFPVLSFRVSYRRVSTQKCLVRFLLRTHLYADETTIYHRLCETNHAERIEATVQVKSLFFESVVGVFFSSSSRCRRTYICDTRRPFTTTIDSRDAYLYVNDDDAFEPFFAPMMSRAICEVARSGAKKKTVWTLDAKTRRIRAREETGCERRDVGRAVPFRGGFRRPPPPLVFSRFFSFGSFSLKMPSSSSLHKQQQQQSVVSTIDQSLLLREKQQQQQQQQSVRPWRYFGVQTRANEPTRKHVSD